MAAHYGSAATELAVCVKGVGLAFRSDLDTLALSGHPAWLDHVLGKALGGRIPQTGSATAMAGALCCRVDAEHAVVVAPAARPRAGGASRGRRSWSATRSPSPTGRRTSPCSRSSGRAARRLLASAGLTGEPADVRDGALAGVPVVLVREHDDALPAGRRRRRRRDRLARAGRRRRSARARAVGSDALAPPRRRAARAAGLDPPAGAVSASPPSRTGRLEEEMSDTQAAPAYARIADMIAAGAA